MPRFVLSAVHQHHPLESFCYRVFHLFRLTNQADYYRVDLWMFFFVSGWTEVKIAMSLTTMSMSKSVNLCMCYSWDRPCPIEHNSNQNRDWENFINLAISEINVFQYYSIVVIPPEKITTLWKKYYFIIIYDKLKNVSIQNFFLHSHLSSF